jgi:hypothetical protein
MVEFYQRRLNLSDIPPSHIGLWYPETFKALAAATGLKFIAHEIEPWHFLSILYAVGLTQMSSVAYSNPQGFAARARAIRNRRLRHVASLAAGGLMLLPLLPAVLKLDCGGAQLAVFRNPN